jgi:hypothetical protein
LRPHPPTADRIVTIVGDQNSARLLRVGHNDEEFLKTCHPGRDFSVATDSRQSFGAGRCPSPIPHPDVTRITDRGAATSYSGSWIPRSEGERVMIDTWDWILIYSILFLLGGLLARADNKSGAHPQNRTHRPQ